MPAPFHHIVSFANSFIAVMVGMILYLLTITFMVTGTIYFIREIRKKDYPRSDDANLKKE